VADDTPSNLRTRSSVHGAVSLTLHGSDSEGFLSFVQGVSGVRTAKILEQNANEFRVRVFPEKPDVPIADKVIASLSQRNDEVKSVFVEKGRLDEVFRNITSDS
jgi:ABC-2 type transport system ATP-binding protein